MKVESQGKETLIHDFHLSMPQTLLIMPLLHDLQLGQTRRVALPLRASLCFILSVRLITAALRKYAGPTKKLKIIKEKTAALLSSCSWLCPSLTNYQPPLTQILCCARISLLFMPEI